MRSHGMSSSEAADYARLVCARLAAVETAFARLLEDSQVPSRNEGVCPTEEKESSHGAR